MVRRTKQEAERTRRRILDAAEDVFSNLGGATSLDAIAEVAGVTRGAVYWHFANKHALLAELSDEWRLPLEELTPGACIADDCQRLIDAILSSLREHVARRRMQILLQEAEWGEARPHIQGRIRRARQHVTHHLKEVLERALVAGELPTTFTRSDIEPTALTLRALVTGLVSEGLREPRVANPSSHVRKVIRSFFGLLTAAG